MANAEFLTSVLGVRLGCLFVTCDILSTAFMVAVFQCTTRLWVFFVQCNPRMFVTDYFPECSSFTPLKRLCLTASYVPISLISILVQSLQFLYSRNSYLFSLRIQYWCFITYLYSCFCFRVVCILCLPVPFFSLVGVGYLIFFLVSGGKIVEVRNREMISGIFNYE